VADLALHCRLVTLQCGLQWMLLLVSPVAVSVRDSTRAPCLVEDVATKSLTCSQPTCLVASDAVNFRVMVCIVAVHLPAAPLAAVAMGGSQDDVADFIKRKYAAIEEAVQSVRQILPLPCMLDTGPL
jgi:hypothetical protein